MCIWSKVQYDIIIQRCQLSLVLALILFSKLTLYSSILWGWMDTICSHWHVLQTQPMGGNLENR